MNTRSHVLIILSFNHSWLGYVLDMCSGFRSGKPHTFLETEPERETELVQLYVSLRWFIDLNLHAGASSDQTACPGLRENLTTIESCCSCFHHVFLTFNSKCLPRRLSSSACLRAWGLTHVTCPPFNSLSKTTQTCLFVPAANVLAKIFFLCTRWSIHLQNERRQRAINWNKTLCWFTTCEATSGRSKYFRGKSKKSAMKF